MDMYDHVYVMSLSLYVYGDWMIYSWWMINLIKMLCFDEFCRSRFLQFVFLKFLMNMVMFFFEFPFFLFSFFENLSFFLINKRKQIFFSGLLSATPPHMVDTMLAVVLLPVRKAAHHLGRWPDANFGISSYLPFLFFWK